MAPPPAKKTDADALLGFIVTSITLWIIQGSLAYGDGTFVSPDALPFVTMPLVAFQIPMLVFALHEAETARPGRTTARLTAALTGLSFMTVYAVMTGGWENNPRRIFWCMGGLWVGVLVEALTGVFTFASAAFSNFMAGASKRE